MRLPLFLRLALRELRGGLAGFRVLLACLALGVAAIAAVGSVRAAIEAGLAREAAALLGGDAEVEFAYRFADPDERAWMEGAARAVSGIVDFRSLAAGADGERTLVQVKAVDGGYPLYGTVRLAGGGSLDDALSPRDGLPGIVAERILVDRLGLAPGDTLTLGTRAFRLAGTTEAIPDAGGGALAFGPQVIVRLADLEGSGLLSEGSLFDSSYRLRLAPVAPRVFSVAIVAVRVSRCARTAEATPMPPTASPASPSRIRKSASRSTKRPTPGAPSRRSRHCSPRSANRAPASASSAARSASGGSRSR